MFNETGFYISTRRKKKSSTSIVPASFFKKEPATNTTTEQKTTSEVTNNAIHENPTSAVSAEAITEKATANPIQKPVALPNIPIAKRAGSALSLKSIQQKKQFVKKKVIITEDPENLPKTEFTEEQALKLWNEYGKRMDKKGERIIGSMFAMNKPVLQDNFELLLELPNETMRIDVESISKPLLAFMHEELNNYSISIKIDVNEEAAVKHAFTPEDKYNKLKERNPLIDLLRTKLDLDI